LIRITISRKKGTEMNAIEEVYEKGIRLREDPRVVPLVQPLKRLIMEAWQEKVTTAQARGESRVTIFQFKRGHHFENGTIVFNPEGPEYTRISSILHQIYGGIFGCDLLTQIAEEVKPFYLFANVIFECQDEVDTSFEDTSFKDTSEEVEERKCILSHPRGPTVLNNFEDRVVLCWEPEKEKYRGEIIEECPLCNRMTTLLESFHRSDAPANKKAHWACTNCVSEMESTYGMAECPFCREVCLEV
jgi:hypothetical protein